MDNKSKFVAHVKQDEYQWQEPQVLIDHLIGVSSLAATFASNEMKQWLIQAGKWHDLGKYLPEFQFYIREQSGYLKDIEHFSKVKANVHRSKVVHSTMGAIHACKSYPQDYIGVLMAYLIAGHHGGLSNWDSLKHRLLGEEKEYTKAISSLPKDITKTISDLKFPSWIDETNIALWLRIAFSCLVDADFLDTEAYMNPHNSQKRTKVLTLEELYPYYTSYMDKITRNAKPSLVQKKRAEILNSALKAADDNPGIFSFTVPTGGGKTLATLGFALKHAKKFNKKRIIYAIPFTSIIEQTADVFRKVFAELKEDVVLEHHSNVIDDSNIIKNKDEKVTDNTRDSSKKKTGDDINNIEEQDVDYKNNGDKENNYRQLACENWDAPLIVTTNVQLFESLFASKTGRCRKVHNIQDSVIILDEAQQLPRDFHAPITMVMQQLSKFFGVTFVLCSATQPVLTKQKDSFGKDLFIGLSKIKEIIVDPVSLALDLRRVNINFDDTVYEWSDIAKKVLDKDCVLCIVNTRAQARKLFKLLPKSDENIHLSANMCAEHRTKVIEKIKNRLELRRQGDKKPLRVISTQLVEAGVDFDFPCVFREMAGLDSIAQAAGRCNREGLMAQKGEVLVFRTEEAAPTGILRDGENVTLELLHSNLEFDALSPESFSAYFNGLNNKGDRDLHNICGLLTAEPDLYDSLDFKIEFKEAADKFKLIDEKGSISVIVPYKTDENESEIHKLIAYLENKENTNVRWVYRKLQRFSISLRDKMVETLFAKNLIEIRAGLYVLNEHYYDSVLGFSVLDDELTAYESTVG